MREQQPKNGVIDGADSISVDAIVAAYCSQATIKRSLEHLLRQSRAFASVIVVDSSPDDQTAAVVQEVAQHNPAVRLIRSVERLLPHEARERGIQDAQAELLLFTDPDMYAEHDWLERMVALWVQRRPAMVGGGVACWDLGWFQRGVHICKFSRWLPGGKVRRVDNIPTASLLIERRLFWELGGFPDPMSGDALLSMRAIQSGDLLLEPLAVAFHHHATTLRGFVRERFVRGRRWAATVRPGDRAASRWLRFAATLLVVRLVRILWLVARDCRRGPGLTDYFSAFPLLVLGHGCSLFGEAVGMLFPVSSRTT